MCKDVVHKNGFFIAILHSELYDETIEVKACNLHPYYHLKRTSKEERGESRVGEQYGDLEVLEYIGYTWNNQTYRCRCVKCGMESNRTIVALRKNIQHGRECVKQIEDSEIKKTIIQRWNAMYERCNNPNNPNYKHYGARGIKLLYQSAADLYMDFADELKEHARKYGLKNSTFDRIDVNGNYEKSNLRIATQSIQNSNTTRNKIFIIEKDGERVLSDCALVCGNALGINGRSLGNVVRGSSKSSGGWRLYKIIDPSSDLEEISKIEGVTTKILVTRTSKEDSGETPESVAPSISEEIKR